MRTTMSAKAALEAYARNPKLKGGYGEQFGQRLVCLEQHADRPNLISFKYTFALGQHNIQDSVHGGALATMVDVATTIGIMRMTPLRTVSVSIATDYLNMIRVDEEVEIDCEVTKIGKSLVFSECRILTDLKGARRLACVGKHVKSIFAEKWDFLHGN